MDAPPPTHFEGQGGIERQTVESPYGPLCLYTCGPPGADVILFVHGSGPTASGSRYAPLLLQVGGTGAFYAVAMDCPGYGQSSGSRDMIRSDPTGVFRAILKGLGKSSAVALVGVSQGAAAALRACVSDPRLTATIICDRALYGPIDELCSIRQRTLLVYNKDDAGHPVSVGKRIQKAIQGSEYVEYSSKRNPSFVADNYAAMILKFVQKTK